MPDTNNKAMDIFLNGVHFNDEIASRLTEKEFIDKFSNVQFKTGKKVVHEEEKTAQLLKSAYKLCKESLARRKSYIKQDDYVVIPAKSSTEKSNKKEKDTEEKKGT